ncbi:NAD-dependent epimerase/dehydratase family protein [Streptomyces sp. NPDC056690]|uniref:NAD-dependent epimerase/dehydratase family protein n=1 Tax=Streptomyces sp. NPDC056690 TaxID=3345912 RepID=UPI003691DD2B
MRILLLGGTWFLGRAVAENALARGWRVTTFNRGRSAPDLPGTEPVHGDRTSADDLKRLAGYGPWDLVVDTSASEMAPCQVLDGTRVLAAEAERYVYVSTVNAYRGWPHEALTEDSPVYAAPPDASREYGAGDGVTVHYGMQKAGCEAAVLSQFGDRATVLRPGVILGPGEYVGRLPWWLSRARRGGAILAPGQPGTHVQPVDVRDVAEFALSASPGAYNVAAPRDRDTMGDLLGACVAVTGSRGRLFELGPGELAAQLGDPVDQADGAPFDRGGQHGFQGLVGAVEFAAQQAGPCEVDGHLHLHRPVRAGIGVEQLQGVECGLLGAL